MDTLTAWTRLGGTAGTRELRSSVTQREIGRAVAAGEVVRPHQGRYAVPGLNEALEAAHRAGGTVSHLSAARSWGWQVRRPPERPVVTVPRTRRLTSARRQGVDVRWGDLNDADDVVGGVTSRARTVVDCVRTLPFPEALCVADSALREGKVDRAQMLAGARRSPRVGRSRAIRVIERADARSANPFESCLRAIAMDVPGLHVEPQGWVGSIGMADLTDPVLRIAVEAESWEYHGLPEAFRHDIRRYTAMTRLGWLVARFVYEDVMSHPDRVRAALEDLVRVRAEQSSLRHP